MLVVIPDYVWLSYLHKDFQDLVAPTSLEDNPVDNPVDNPAEMDLPHKVTDTEMTAVCHTHQLLFSTLTSSDWLKQSHVTDITTQEVIQPSLLCYSVAAPWFDGQWDCK